MFGFEGVGLKVKVNESFHCSSIYLGCMIEVVQGHILNERLDEIIRNATERLMLVSPYIRLHHRTVDALKLLKQNLTQDLQRLWMSIQHKLLVI